MSEYPSYGKDPSSPNKRHRPDNEERKEQFPDSSNVSGPAFSSSYAASQYPVRRPSLSSGFSMPQYPAFANVTTGATSPYQFRPSIGNSSSYFPEPIQQTSGTNTIPGTIPTQRYPDMQPQQQQQQPYSQMFSYGHPRANAPSALFFPEDTTGLNIYRMGSTAGLEERY
jgi:hypothetical protein